MDRLKGRVAFVTGAAGGIGTAACRRFISEGAQVVATDIDVDGAHRAIVGASPGQAFALACNVWEAGPVRNAIACTVAAFERLDVLCNIAGGSSTADNIVTEAPEEEFWRVIELDLFGTFNCCKHAISELIRSGGGSVINLTSMAALMALPGRDCYTAAKGGVASLTRSLAAEYAQHSVRVNAIAPGFVATKRVRSAVSASPALARVVSEHLLGPGEPDDIAHLAVYLVSAELRIVTGHIISADSGITIH